LYSITGQTCSEAYSSVDIPEPILWAGRRETLGIFSFDECLVVGGIDWTKLHPTTNTAPDQVPEMLPDMAESAA